jgi:medium-chain acyl-[acyl-carrier-protein] hydrolase
VSQPHEWCIRWRPRPTARLRLFCVAHAGGGASAYRSWAARLPPEIEVVALQPPGRENRLLETPLCAVSDLVPRIVDTVQPLLELPHAWFGHSLGALVAFETCHELRRRGMPAPVRLAVSGRPAPHLPQCHPPIHDAPAADLVTRLRELDGTPRALLDDAETLAALLPLLRADLKMSETYQWRPGPPLDYPISVFGGRQDQFASLAELQAWHRHTTRGCIVRVLPGGHFFLHEQPEHILSAMANDLFGVNTMVRADGLQVSDRENVRYGSATPQEGTA